MSGYVPMHLWTEPDMHWRAYFDHRYLNYVSINPQTKTMFDFIVAWEQFVTMHITPLCKHPFKAGSITVYFSDKEDVAKVRLMLADAIASVMSQTEFSILGGMMSCESEKRAYQVKYAEETDREIV